MSSNYDGTSGLTGAIITGEKIDRIGVWHGTSNPTAGSNDVPTNGLFLNTSSGILYENTGSLATPTWTVRMVNVEDDLPYLKLSTTIGDYTTPAAVYDASITDLDSGVEYGTKAHRAGGVVNITFDRSTTNHLRSLDIQTLIGASVNSTSWVLRFKYTISTQTASTSAEAYEFIGMSDLDGSTGIIPAKDFMGLCHMINTGSDKQLYVSVANGSNPVSDLTLITGASVTTYYVEMIRNGDTITVKLFPDSTYTTPDYTGSRTLAGISGLRYFVIGNYNNSASFNGSGICQVDDFKFDNGVTTFGTPEFTTTFTSPEYLYDDTVGTNYQTANMASPAVYADLTSNREIVGVALHLDRTNTTVTAIKIRASTDTTFTDAENIAYINVSDFTDDTWRFIANNFLADNRRYVQIIGVGTGVLSLNEIKVRYGVSDLNKILGLRIHSRDVDAADSFVDSN